MEQLGARGTQPSNADVLYGEGIILSMLNKAQEWLASASAWGHQTYLPCENTKTNDSEAYTRRSGFSRQFVRYWWPSALSAVSAFIWLGLHMCTSLPDFTHGPDERGCANHTRTPWNLCFCSSTAAPVVMVCPSKHRADTHVQSSNLCLMSTVTRALKPGFCPATTPLL